MIFFKIYRKRGCYATLSILKKYPNYRVKENIFFKELRKAGLYLNDFYRVRNDLLKYGIISYTLDDEFAKVIYLTETGIKILQMVEEIDEMLKENVGMKEDNKDEGEAASSEEAAEAEGRITDG